LTSSVFGGITARRFGYGKVSLRKRIALGHSECEVAIYFEPNEMEEDDIYQDLPITPKNGNPFEWEEETIKALHTELEKSDKMITSLVEELEHLRKLVKEK